MTVINSDRDIPFVAVWIVTYNHEKYIATTIESILGQKTDFKVKLFIGEDCSKDNTGNICLSYVEKYADRIELISTKQNNIRTNVDNVWKATIASGAKYIAMCEGDDYWTDPYKLQKQVTFLDNNPDFSICFTNVDTIDEVGMENPYSFPKLDKDVFALSDVILNERSFIPTSTLLFRNIVEYPLPSFYTDTNIGDLALLILFSDVGKVKFIDEKMAVYRLHSGGMTQSSFFKVNEYQLLYKLYEDANKHFNYKYDYLLGTRLLEVSKTILIYGSQNKRGLERIKHVTRSFSKYLKHSKPINIKEVLYYIAILFFPFILKRKDKK